MRERRVLSEAERRVIHRLGLRRERGPGRVFKVESSGERVYLRFSKRHEKCPQAEGKYWFSVAPRLVGETGATILICGTAEYTFVIPNCPSGSGSTQFPGLRPLFRNQNPCKDGRIHLNLSILPLTEGVDLGKVDLHIGAGEVVDIRGLWHRFDLVSAEQDVLEPLPGWSDEPERFDQCGRCGRPVHASEMHYFAIRPEDPDSDFMYIACEGCAWLPDR